MVFFSVGAYSVPTQTTLSDSTAYVIPGGEAVGIKLYTKGLLVVGISENPSPSADAGIKRGDILLSANGVELYDTSQLSDIVSENEKIILEYARDENRFSVEITPKIISGIKRIGVWVRDSTAGLGTMTFYSGNKFAALGHAVTDPDTAEIMSLSAGSITGADVVGVQAGKKGTPGELIGTFKDDTIGSINLNCSEGLYGICTDTPQKELLKIAERSEINEGSAYILADIDGNGVQQYTINIERVSLYAHSKPIVFRVTDQRLLDTTGGIVQGMSGAPIIQNNMLIGAVTHVFVNDPTRGYGIFAESMLKNCNTEQ